MKKILVESSKSFSYGFNLAEPELRRIVDIGLEQLNKINNDPNIATYTLKYENGVEEETNELDEVLGLENSGSTKIVYFEIELKKQPKEEKPESWLNDPTSKIIIVFNNTLKNEKFYSSPITLIVKGETRDWVFVTKSILEERIQKVKTFSFLDFKSLDSRMVVGIGMILFMTALLYATYSGMNLNTNNRVQELNDLRSKYLKAGNNDIVNTIIDIQIININSESNKAAVKSLFTPMLKATFYGIILILGIYMISLLVKKLFPPFIFNWGDYIDVYKKVKNQRNILFIVLILGIVASIIGGLIANNIRI